MEKCTGICMQDEEQFHQCCYNIPAARAPSQQADGGSMQKPALPGTPVLCRLLTHCRAHASLRRPVRCAVDACYHQHWHLGAWRAGTQRIQHGSGRRGMISGVQVLKYFRAPSALPEAQAVIVSQLFLMVYRTAAFMTWWSRSPCLLCMRCDHHAHAIPLGAVHEGRNPAVFWPAA